MHAVIISGGKQYRVAKDDVIEVDLIDAKQGDTITIDQVLLVGSKIGAPTVSGASVKATIVEHIRDDKIIVFKKKRRQNYRRKHGHRQDLTVLKITDIKG
jgi:large subunit ribosomal protein L21